VKRDESDWPQRLSHRDDAVGRIMRRYVRRPDGREDDSSAYLRTRATMRRRRTRDSLLSLAIVAGAVGASFFTLRGQRPALVTAPEVDPPARTSAPAPMPVPPPATTRPAASVVTAPRSVRLGTRTVPLPEGETDLLGEARVTVSSATRATGHVHGGASTIALAAGRVDLRVQARAPGRSFVVTAGSFRFVVVGTAFSVRRHGPEVFLEVSEGTVAVMRDRRQLAVVTAAGSWTGRGAGGARPAPLAQASPRCPAAVGPAAARDAITCLERQAAIGSASQREAAAYEAARLWKDEVRDLERARFAFRAYQRRFPRGALQLEASLSLLELLPRLGRHQEALAESARLLADRAAATRWSEIHTIRGNIFREGLADATAAAAEVRAAADAERGQRLMNRENQPGGEQAP
jgi:hypothetical protein